MFDVISCLTTEHDYRLVLTAAFICLLGTVTSFLLFDRNQRQPGAPRIWTLAAGAATGVTIWVTHLVAMLAYNGGMPIGFALDITALSAAVGVVTSTVGYLVATRGGSVRAACGGAVIGLASARCTS